MWCGDSSVRSAITLWLDIKASVRRLSSYEDGLVA